VWNAAKFVHLYSDEEFSEEVIEVNCPENIWILHTFNSTLTQFNESIENYKISDAYKLLYNFLWSEQFDWYFEFAKTLISNLSHSNETKYVLRKIFLDSLKLLNPAMPHLTEEIWSSFKKTYLIDEDWPLEISFNDEESNQIEQLKEVISQIRNFRTNYKISNKIILEIYTTGNLPDWFLLQLQEIAKVNVKKSKNSKNNSKIVFSALNISLEINAEEYIDIDFELTRLNKKINELEKSRNISEQRLQNVNFVNNANQELIDKEKNNLKILTEEIELLQATIKNLTN